MAVVQQAEKLTVDNSEDVVVFMLGARVNRWWLLPLTLPIMNKMSRMLKELQSDADSGLLGVRHTGATTIQYWRSLEHLLAYTERNDRAHKPTVRAFYKRLFSNRALGLWHELFVVKAGHYEGLYANMPPMGLGTVRPLLPATGKLGTARKRLAAALAQRRAA